MTYAKLIDGKLIPAPNPILIDGRYIGNPPGTVYESEGFKVVVYADNPGEAPEGFKWSERWTEEDYNIQQYFVLEEVPITDEEALVRYINELTGAESENLIEATETLIKKEEK